MSSGRLWNAKPQVCRKPHPYFQNKVNAGYKKSAGHSSQTFFTFSNQKLYRFIPSSLELPLSPHSGFTPVYFPAHSFVREQSPSLPDAKADKRNQLLKLVEEPKKAQKRRVLKPP